MLSLKIIVFSNLEALSSDSINEFYRILNFYIIYSSYDELNKNMHYVVNFVKVNTSVYAKEAARIQSFTALLEITKRCRNEVPDVIILFRQSFYYEPFLNEGNKGIIFPSFNNSMYFFL